MHFDKKLVGIASLGLLLLSSVSLKGQANDLVTPRMVDQAPEAGKRVRRVIREYQNSEVYHALYLPVDWKPGHTYPVIVEYPGNQFAKSGSTGKVEGANLGYGLSGGEGFIWITLPCVDSNGPKNALHWWGDRQATIEYCKRVVPSVCRQFGGDPNRVFICGFSRGAIATSYIGLADDQIAALWKGVITHDHFDGDRRWNYPESDRESALRRLRRLKGRPVLACGIGTEFLKQHAELAEFTFLRPPIETLFNIPEAKVIHHHTDLWLHRRSRYQQQARTWLAKVAAAEVTSSETVGSKRN